MRVCVWGGGSFGKGGVAIATQVMAARDWSCWQPTRELQVKRSCDLKQTDKQTVLLRDDQVQAFAACTSVFRHLTQVAASLSIDK